MLTFMDYVVLAFGTSTDWNHDNSYSSLTATSDALLAFPIPSTLSLHVSSLSTPNFASSYTLSTLGQIDGSISYLYSTVPLDHIPSRSPSIPLGNLVTGYKDIKLPKLSADSVANNNSTDREGRKPTLLHATLALPPPSTLTALYARRINSETLLSISLYSKSISTPTNSGPPPASVLAHVQYDTGRYSVEGLGSTDHSLLGLRGLWNFGHGPRKLGEPPTLLQQTALEASDDLTDLDIPDSIKPSPLDTMASHRAAFVSKPSLLSAGAEFYYSPTSHVIGLSTGLRFTTLAPHSTSPTCTSPSKPLAGNSASLSSSLLTPANIPHSSFPYTMTLTMTPLTGSLASTYSVKPTPNLALSSRFDFNVYSWESRYIIGVEVWRRRRKRLSQSPEQDDPVAWARAKVADWFSDAEQALKTERVEREEENVVKLRVDDRWNFRALWTGRVKELLVSAGVSVSPGKERNSGSAMSTVGSGDVIRQQWTGSVGVEVAYST